MVEADGSQLEFRVAAFLGQDKQAMADIVDPDFDAHVTSASAMFEKDYAELLAAYRAGYKTAGALRTEAKKHTFAPLYGASKGTDETERWYALFVERYAELRATQESWLAEVLADRDGALRTDWGMTFYWDYTLESRQNGRTTIALDRATKRPIKQSVFNYPVQSLARAEIIPIALVALFRRCKRRAIRVIFVNTVHDSVVCEVHKEDIEAFIAEVKPAFTTDVFRYLAKFYKLEFNVPLGCEVKWGTHWGEGEEVKYDATPASIKCPDRARG
jgi:DNA polymerase I-like protein with 3'-5' exonuclease and polymerase domains